ncbi:hypothetical protein [Enterocloster clostridioformis]|nr:hypothetical protein [Enterocloster clostridioformis]
MHGVTRVDFVGRPTKFLKKRKEADWITVGAGGTASRLLGLATNFGDRC